MDQSDAKAHRTNEQHSPLNRGGTLPFHYRGHWARNSIHLRPLANEAESSQSQKLAADHPDATNQHSETAQHGMVMNRATTVKKSSIQK